MTKSTSPHLRTLVTEAYAGCERPVVHLQHMHNGQATRLSDCEAPEKRPWRGTCQAVIALECMAL